jgi:hypothetical protein
MFSQGWDVKGTGWDKKSEGFEGWKIGRSNISWKEKM